MRALVSLIWVVVLPYHLAWICVCVCELHSARRLLLFRGSSEQASICTFLLALRKIGYELPPSLGFFAPLRSIPDGEVKVRCFLRQLDMVHVISGSPRADHIHFDLAPLARDARQALALLPCGLYFLDLAALQAYTAVFLLFLFFLTHWSKFTHTHPSSRLRSWPALAPTGDLKHRHSSGVFHAQRLSGPLRRRTWRTRTSPTSSGASPSDCCHKLSDLRAATSSSGSPTRHRTSSFFMRRYSPLRQTALPCGSTARAGPRLVR